MMILSQSEVLLMMFPALSSDRSLGVLHPGLGSGSDFDILEWSVSRSRSQSNQGQIWVCQITTIVGRTCNETNISKENTKNGAPSSKEEFLGIMILLRAIIGCAIYSEWIVAVRCWCCFNLIVHVPIMRDTRTCHQGPNNLTSFPAEYNIVR